MINNYIRSHVAFYLPLVQWSHFASSLFGGLLLLSSSHPDPQQEERDACPRGGDDVELAHTRLLPEKTMESCDCYGRCLQDKDQSDQKTELEMCLPFDDSRKVNNLKKKHYHHYYVCMYVYVSVYVCICNVCLCERGLS
ncbi:hypothetical protein STEG23_027908, partial [Scotinomys teguina]